MGRKPAKKSPSVEPIEKTDANLRRMYELWLSHWSMYDLCQEFHLGTTTVKKWLEEATALWDDEDNLSSQLCQKRVIAQVNATIKDAKEQFLRSCEDEVTRKQERKETDDGIETSRSKIRKKQSGNPVYLSVIQNGLKMLQQIHGAHLSTNIRELVADLPYDKAAMLEEAIKEIVGNGETQPFGTSGPGETDQGSD
jgi:ribosomal protein L32E